MKNKILLIAFSVFAFSCNQESEIKETILEVDVKTATVKVVNPELKSFTSNLSIIIN